MIAKAHLHIALFCLIALLASACGVKKHIPEGSYLLQKGEIKIENKELAADDKQLEDKLEEVLAPKTNTKFLGGYPGVYFYYKMQRKRPGFINKFFYKKIGEAPVFSSALKIPNVITLLENRLENKGYFYSNVTASTERNESKKEETVSYQIKLGKPYKLAKFELDSLPGTLSVDLKNTMDASLIEVGQNFDLAILKAERERIDAALKAKGYYNFNSGFLTFEADTNLYDDHRFDLFLGLKSNVPAKANLRYEIAEVEVYPAFQLEGDTLATKQISELEGVKFIGGENFIRADRLAPFITLAPGQWYAAKTSRATARRLSAIGAYRFVNIQYEVLERDSTDRKGSLKAIIELSPLNKRSFGVEIQAVSKSNNFAGPALLTTYTNRNLFKGGEVLKLSGQFGYEFQVQRGNASNYNLNLGMKGELIFPRLLLPIKFKTDFFKYDIPRTKMSLSVERSDRSGLYKLASATASIGGIWNAAKFVTHELSIISINFNNLFESSNTFDALLEDNPFLRQSFEQTFIAGLTYSFTYNELVNSNLQHAIFFNSNFDMAGNMLSLFAKENGSEPSTIIGLDFTQYAKLDFDLRYHFRMPKERTVAARLFSGIGLPYGNAEVMPFTKLYSAGGPYGMRAFGIRSIGPGTYMSDGAGNQNFFEQQGNIKLEANLEYRFPLISYLKGAVFTDVGNVWLLEENEDFPGGTFDKNFLQTLGMGVGVGARVDVQGFVLRFDFATPVKQPASERAAFNFEFESTQFNFAIGYPF